VLEHGEHGAEVIGAWLEFSRQVSDVPVKETSVIGEAWRTLDELGS
jgi:hypothetical protein